MNKLSPKGVKFCPICDEKNNYELPRFKFKEATHKKNTTKIISIYSANNNNQKKLF